VHNVQSHPLTLVDARASSSQPLWANLHGAFVVGLGLLAVELVAAAWRRDQRSAIRFLLVGGASVARLLVNPWGARVLAYPALLSTKPAVTGMVTEWAPQACGTRPARCCWPRSASSRSHWLGPRRPAEPSSRSFGWRCWPGWRYGRSGRASGSDWRCRSRCAPWRGTVHPGRPRPTAACRRSTARGGRAGGRRRPGPAAGQAVAPAGGRIPPGAAVRSGGGRPTGWPRTRSPAACSTCRRGG
jgi:hypothetical protein